MGRAVFREFLKCEYSEENILFWLACEDLKKDNSPEVVEEKARLIYEDYISILSPKEVREHHLKRIISAVLFNGILNGDMNGSHSLIRDDFIACVFSNCLRRRGAVIANEQLVCAFSKTR